MALFLVKILQLIASYYTISIQVHDFEPILNTLDSCFILDTHNEPNKVSKSHFLLVLEFLHTLREYSLKCLSGKRISRIFRQLLSAELKVMIIIEFPKFDVNDIEIFIAEELSIFVDIRLTFNVKQTFQNI